MDIGTSKKKTSQKTDAEYTEMEEVYKDDMEYLYDLVGIEDVVQEYREYLKQENQERERRKAKFARLKILPIICKLFSKKDSLYYSLLDK